MDTRGRTRGMLNASAEVGPDLRKTAFLILASLVEEWGFPGQKDATRG